MAVYVLTPKEGKVTGTHTNFPVYMDFSAMGITTLAQAQSVRVYTDAGLTTEIAREVVSATEGHAKVPTFSSASEIYIDWDGLRADYAPTDTYGRNAVWSDFAYVGHMEGNADNQTGGTNPSATTNITFNSINGRLGGQGAGFNGSSSIISGNYALPVSHTISFWGRHNATNQIRFISKDNGSSDRNIAYEFFDSGSPKLTFYQWNASNTLKIVGVSAFAISNWYLFHTTWDSSGNVVAYLNATSAGSAATGGNARNSAALLHFGGQTGLARWLNGAMDEIRITSLVRSADWITTEHNNQNDVGAFWDITPVGGASTGFFNFF